MPPPPKCDKFAGTNEAWWMKNSGGDRLKQKFGKNDKTYKEYCTLKYYSDPVAIRDIRHLELYAMVDRDARQYSSIVRVLVAVYYYTGRLYDRDMASLCAFLLRHCCSEEGAFWTLCGLSSWAMDIGIGNRRLTQKFYECRYASWSLPQTSPIPTEDLEHYDPIRAMRICRALEAVEGVTFGDCTYSPDLAALCAFLLCHGTTEEGVFSIVSSLVDATG